MSDLVVEQIIGRKVFSGKVFYLTKWKGFSEEEATWQTIKVLKGFKSLIKEYCRERRRLRSDNNIERHQEVEDQSSEVQEEVNHPLNQCSVQRRKPIKSISPIDYLVEYEDGSIEKMGLQQMLLRCPGELERVRLSVLHGYSKG